MHDEIEELDVNIREFRRLMADTLSLLDETEKRIVECKEKILNYENRVQKYNRKLDYIINKLRLRFRLRLQIRYDRLY